MKITEARMVVIIFAPLPIIQREEGHVRMDLINPRVHLLKRLSFASIEDACAVISGFLIFVLIFLTVIDVSGRYLFAMSLLGTVEISEVLMPAMIMLAVSVAQRRNEHIGVDTLIDVFKKSPRPIYPAFQLFGLSVTGLALAFALFYCLKDLISSVAMHDTTAGPLYIIMWPTKMLLCFGLLLTLIRIALQFCESAQSLKAWGIK